MENALAQLSINEEEHEIIQIQPDLSREEEGESFLLVGCFLTANIIHFPAMKSAWLTYGLTGFEIWGKKIHDVPVSLYSENLAIQIRNFIGVFLEYDGSNLGKENRTFMRIRVQIDVRRPLKREKTDSIIWEMFIFQF
ncbi:hypothetical protein ES332_A09G135200v1 [Gossypium tomentosum]|uniref:Uncharacterized protein n=1 Tax=Gossypium tomentosum TaxID=34277 RepID=A0A5D2P3R6_GOSTO|nr:hypothetical protein ES332_A09G135200v1 [Gossypium tomentosum]